jgi:demethylspheroidene O-methyltransferase
VKPDAAATVAAGLDAAAAQRCAAGSAGPAPSRGAVIDALRRRRDRWLADPRFQRLAGAFPLTRWIARSRARALFGLCAAFIDSQVLYACVSTGLLRRLLDQPQLPAQLAQSLGIAPDRLQTLLAAARTLDLVESRSGGRVGLGMSGAALLGNPGVEAMILHHAVLYADLADPVALLRRAAPSGGLSSFWGYAGASDPARLSSDQVAPYSRLMSASQQFIADVVLAAYPFERHRRLLDVGGGDGTFAMAAARKAPALQVEVFDLPEVARAAQARLEAAGLQARARTWGGSFAQDELPRGADLVTLVRVVHDHDDDKVRELLASIRRSMDPGGTLLLAEPMAGPDAAGALVERYFSMYLLAMGSGRPRTRDELQSMLREAGFDSIRAHRTHNPLLASVVTARPRR